MLSRIESECSMKKKYYLSMRHYILSTHNDVAPFLSLIIILSSSSSSWQFSGSLALLSRDLEYDK